MELQHIKDLLIKYLETGPLPDEEGQQLLLAMDQLIEKNELRLLAGTDYKTEGISKVLTEEEVENCYWEIFMYYEDFEAHDEHHHHDDDDDDDEEKSHLTKWWWVYFILAAIGFFVIWKMTQGPH
jgi:hypothetical protein